MRVQRETTKGMDAEQPGSCAFPSFDTGIDRGQHWSDPEGLLCFHVFLAAHVIKLASFPRDLKPAIISKPL